MDKLPGVGARVRVRIKRVLQFGLEVQVDNAGTGLVRPREISWNPTQQQHWRDQFHTGDHLDAVVVRADGQRLELSLRFAERDPWLELNLVPGECQNGTIIAVDDHAAYVELTPGVEGRLPAHNLPPGVSQPLGDLFWPRDHIYVIVQSVDLQLRQVLLTLQGVAEERRQRLTATATAPQHPEPAPAPTLPERTEAQWPLLDADGHRTHTILLVEDDLDLQQLMASWLQNAGHHVVVADNAEAVPGLLASVMPEILITDLRLPGADGLTLARRMRNDHPGVACVVMTDWVTADERQGELDRLEQAGIDLLLKPVLANELLHLAAHAGRLPQPDELGGGAEAGSAAGNSALLPPIARRHATANSYAHVLNELLQLSRAAQVLLFAFDRTQRQVRLAGRAGRGLLHEEHIADLIYSPVRDVAEDRRVVQVEDAQNAENYVRYLRPLLDFRSFVGVPVIGDDTEQLALFLFSQETGFVGRVVEHEARLAATAVAALQARKSAEERMAEMQRITLLGHLTRGLVHETNNQIGRILLALNDLEPDCERLQRMAANHDATLESELFHTGQKLKQLGERVHSLARTTRMYGRFTVQDQDAMVRIDRVVERCIDMVSDLAANARVQVAFQRPDHVFATRARQTQIQQIVLNLLLNAVQQTSLLYPRQGGLVRVRIDLRPNGKRIFIRVHVEDNGPGIHHRWWYVESNRPGTHDRAWSQIFKPGVTTRKGSGSGMGLFIARHLAESVGGQVLVAESAPLWGTHMVAEFPILIEA